MPDGIRLSARVWWPRGAGPFPAILEYIPYRKRDLVRARDERNHPYFAEHGYVSIRVDMRGSGDSEGSMADMYEPVELSDAAEVIEWIAKQHWCSGNVGMFGTSWGGTASLQAAANPPAALKAVIANCATANRFDDDIHWMGGALLTDSFEWGATLPAILGAPPDKATVGDCWMQMWRQRLECLAFPLHAWIKNCIRGEYWRHGSVEFTPDRISRPILAIGGWADRYSNSVMQLVQARPDLCWGIVGPWGHHYPDQGEPGPAVNFQQIALQWWSHWLKDQVAGPPQWPHLQLWQRSFDPPQNRLTMRSGNWIEVDQSMQVRNHAYFLHKDRISPDQPTTNLTLQIPNDLRHGECAGDTGYFGRTGGLPLEQSTDDARSLCFDSEPLAEDLEITGNAEVFVELSRDTADAQLVCRLCEVAPSGASNLVVRQIRNLSLDEDLDAHESFIQGKPIAYKIEIPSTAYRFSRGNRIRLAFGTSYWPLIWPINHEANVSIVVRKSKIGLPQAMNARSLSTKLPPPNKLPANSSFSIQSKGELERSHVLNPDGSTESGWTLPRTAIRYQDIDTQIAVHANAMYRTDTQPPDSRTTRFDITYGMDISRADGLAVLQSAISATSCRDKLKVKGCTTITWNDEIVADKVWDHSYSLPLKP